MSQLNTRRSFGYSARALFGKDHRRSSQECSDLDEGDFLLRSKKPLSEGSKKLLKYISMLQAATERKQFDKLMGRLYWVLKTSGSDLDMEDHDTVNQTFNNLRDMVLNKTHSEAARWKILELLELRANNWEDSERIAEYYEDPANFKVPCAFIDISKSPPQDTPSTRTRMASGGSSGRSRTGSSSSSGILTYSRRDSAASGLSRQSSRKSDISEDIFCDCDTEDRFPDDGSDSSNESDAGSNSSSSVSSAQYRLLKVNAGKDIKYTRNFLLGCWSSPLCKVMPSSLQHTIRNSDIAYIIRGPPFEDPVRLMCTSDESTVPHPFQRSTSLPAGHIQLNSSSVEQSSTIHSRTQSAVEPIKVGGLTYYNRPPPYALHQGYSPILHKEAWQKAFRHALQQIKK
ncbi:uncharacterized protein [Apostichopus japonicus]|uniref:uncharacterized protein n=1 Tax=Stichopus japonicus TaxID=307972 RepID=UPI003AB7E69B